MGAQTAYPVATTRLDQPVHRTGSRVVRRGCFDQIAAVVGDERIEIRLAKLEVVFLIVHQPVFIERYANSLRRFHRGGDRDLSRAVSPVALIPRRGTV